ncbi:MAG: ribulokinase, partial [Alistipes sp.]|nr:ribulokinase [Alistipes sp.]
MNTKFVIGLDYGSDSARAVVVDVKSGIIVSTAVKYYPRWSKGMYCDPAANRYRQHPLDYIEVLEGTVKEALSKAPAGTAEKVVGIAFDTTGSTPVFVDATGTPLALTPGFEENPNAMFILWKDHTAVGEAAEVNAKCRAAQTDYTSYEGGIYSSEWFWAKAMHVLREDKEVAGKAYSIVEHCDWMPALLTGMKSSREIVRSRCAAGHKAMWHERWGGLPPEEFLKELDPALTGLRDRLFEKTETAERPVGKLCPEWAERLGLTTDVVVAGGAFDCHMGAVGAGVKPYTFVRVIGTSTCDIMVANREEIGDKLIRGICGQVDGSVIPGMIGLEAGQSAFGDVYAWFRRVLEFPIRRIVGESDLLDDETKEKLVAEACDKIIPALTAEAEKIPAGESALVATDWMNGRRTPDADQLLQGAIAGITLGSTAPM